MTRRPPEPDPYVELTDRGVLRDAIVARGRERGRRERAAELATWEGTLRDLAERGGRLVVRTAGDRVHRGVLLAVGIDHLAVRSANGGTVLIAADIVRSVRPEPGSVAPIATGDRERSQDRTLLEALALVIEERPEVVFALREIADPIAGRVVGLGEDVITLRVDGSEGATIYLPVAALREIVVPG